MVDKGMRRLSTELNLVQATDLIVAASLRGSQEADTQSKPRGLGVDMMPDSSHGPNSLHPLGLSFGIIAHCSGYRSWGVLTDNMRASSVSE